MDIHGFLSYKDGVLIVPAKIPRIMKRQVMEGESWNFIDHVKDTLIGYTNGSLYQSGTYGKIYKAKRLVLGRNSDDTYTIIQGPEELIIKRVYPETSNTISELEIDSHVSEALIHVLCWKTMQETGAKWAIPRPYELFCDYQKDICQTLSLGMSFVEGTILHNFIRKEFSMYKVHANSRLFREILGQVAYILYHLQKRLSLNHRDLKANNVIVRPSQHPFVLELEGSKMNTMTEITIIDFGFACQGDCSGTLFQAGSWFPYTDICFKKGRDLAQLIFYIHYFFPLDRYLSPNLYKIIKSLMQVQWAGGTVNILDGFTKEGIPCFSNEYHTGIYEFLRREEVDPVGCEPLAVFKMLSW